MPKLPNFGISLQYLVKEHAEQHEGFRANQYYGFDWGVKASLQCLYQYLKQEVKGEVDFLRADKHQSWFQHFGHQIFLQVDTIIIDGHDQAFSKYSK